MLIVLGKLVLNIYCSTYSLNDSRYGTKRNKANMTLKQGTPFLFYTTTPHTVQTLVTSNDKNALFLGLGCVDQVHTVSQRVTE